MSMSRYDEELANIDFSNPEDIPDFSAMPSSEEEDDCYITHNFALLDYNKLPRKLIAEPCVRLSDLQSMTNNPRNDHREGEYQPMKIYCAHCGNEFIYPNQRNAREKLHYCPNCRANFSKQTHCIPNDYVPCNQTDKMHCCVCGEVYQDMARFIHHCQSHDESEYLKVCANKNPVAIQPHTAVEPSDLDAILMNEYSNSTRGENSITDEANILIVNNPIYSPILPIVNHSIVSSLSLPSSSYCLPNCSNQVVHYDQMLHHNQMALYQHYLNIWLNQSTNANTTSH